MHGLNSCQTSGYLYQLHDDEHGDPDKLQGYPETEYQGERVFIENSTNRFVKDVAFGVFWRRYIIEIFLMRSVMNVFKRKANLQCSRSLRNANIPSCIVKIKNKKWR